MSEVNLLAFEVNLILARSLFFEKRGLFRSPKAPSTEELYAGLESLWSPIDECIFPSLKKDSGTIVRYFYGATIEDGFENTSAKIENSFAAYSILHPERISNVKVYPFDDKDDAFVANQIMQMLSENIQSEKYEVGILYLTDINQLKVDQVFKDAYVELSKKQKGELHLINFSENAFVNISIGSLESGTLVGSLAGEASWRFPEDKLDASAVNNFFTALEITPNGNEFEQNILTRLAANTKGKTRKTSVKSKARKKSSKGKSRISAETAGLLPLAQVIDALKIRWIRRDRYSENAIHTEYDEMMTDLYSGACLDIWADKLCDVEFIRNLAVARSLYALHLEQPENNDISGLLRVADSVVDRHKLNDKSWAKELYEKAVGLAHDSSDFLRIADSVVASYNLNDKIWAKTLYRIAIEKAGVYSASAFPRAYKYKDIAISIAQKEKLDDSDWAKDVFEKAIECAADISQEVSNPYLVIAEAISDEGGLNDKPWAKTVYQKGIDLCEDDEQRQEVINAIRDKLKDTKWAADLSAKFGVQLDDGDEKDALG